MSKESIVLRAHTSEKATKLMDEENTISVIVDRRATKHDIKRFFEETFKVKVVKIRVLITSRGEKKAYIKLAPGYNARELATKLGIV
ncbi:MAG: 50S ribosomal protein L23 [Acidilobaceae archaeon]